MTRMIEVKVEELSGPALDWAVFCAIYNGMQPTVHVIESTTIERKPFIKPLTFPRAISLSYSGAYGIECSWNPSSDWECGGPLIDKYRPDLQTTRSSELVVYLNNDVNDPGPLIEGRGETYLVALCRAIVAAQLGPVVSVPAELVTP